MSGKAMSGKAPIPRWLLWGLIAKAVVLLAVVLVVLLLAALV